MNLKCGRYRAAFDLTWTIVSIPFGYDPLKLDGWLDEIIPNAEWYWRTKGRTTEFAFVDARASIIFKLRWA